MVSMRADGPYQPNERDPLGILLYVTRLHIFTFVSPIYPEQGSFGTRVCVYASVLRILPAHTRFAGCYLATLHGLLHMARIPA